MVVHFTLHIQGSGVRRDVLDLTESILNLNKMSESFIKFPNVQCRGVIQIRELQCQRKLYR